MSIVWLLIAFAVCMGIWRFVIRPAVRVRPDEQSDCTPPCKETCNIYDKIGKPIRYECGHDDAPEFKLDLWGEPVVHKLPDNTDS